MEELEAAAERDAEAEHSWRLQYAQALYNCALNDVGNVTAEAIIGDAACPTKTRVRAFHVSNDAMEQ